MKINIEARQTPNIWYFSSAPELRIYALRKFQSDHGETVLPGTVGTDEPHLKIPCTLDGAILRIPEIEIDSTPLNSSARYTAIFKLNGRAVPFLSNFTVPAEPTGTTWANIETYQLIGNMRYVNPPQAELQQLVASMIANALTFLRYGSDSQTGMVALSYPALDLTWPTAVSTTDPTWETLVSTGVSQPWINAADYGVVGDAAVIEDATITADQLSTLNSAAGGLDVELIGKVIAVAGAGPDGATLITTIADVPSPTSLTLTAAAAGAVTNSRAVYGTEDTAQLQAALSAAAEHSTARAVLLPRGNYLFSAGSLEIPQGVTLQGSWEVAPDHLGYRYANEVKPMDGLGTTLVVVSGEGSSTGSFIFVNSEAALRGVSIFYPSQLSTLTTPKSYPWAVEMFGAGPIVEHVELVNPYLGIYSHVGQRHRIADVRGLPLSIGVYASQQLDTSTYKDIDFIGMYTYGNPEGTTTLSNLMRWVHQNGIAFKVGRVDNAVFYNCFSFGYYKGFKLVVDAAETTTFALGSGAPGGKAWAEFTDCGADGCNYPVDIDDVQGHDTTGAMGVTFTNCMFNAAQIHVFAGPELFAVWCRSTMTGRVGLVNCRFHLANRCIRHEAARLDVIGCYFQDWTVNAVSLGNGGVSTFIGNHFKMGSANSVVSIAGSPWASWTGNMFEYVDTDVWANLSATANFNESGNTYATSPIRAAVSFQNGWGNRDIVNYQPATYIKKDGWVEIQGDISAGVVGIGTPAFTLPAGYRPAKNMIFAVSSNGAHASVQVASGGAVSVLVGSNVSVSLDGIRFPIR